MGGHRVGFVRDALRDARSFAAANPELDPDAAPDPGSCPEAIAAAAPETIEGESCVTLAVHDAHEALEA